MVTFQSNLLQTKLEYVTIEKKLQTCKEDLIKILMEIATIKEINYMLNCGSGDGSFG